MISDDKPGHVTQTLGLIKQLEQHFAIECETLKVKPKIKIFNRLLRAFINKRSRYTRFIFQRCYRYDASLLERVKPHLVLSTGGDTCGANAVIALQKKSSNLYLGSIRGHDPSLFTAIISTTPLPHVKNCIVLDVAPTLVDSESLEKAGKEFLERHKLDEKQEYWVMLIGGEGSGYHYSSNDFKQLVDGMLVLARQHKIKWLVTSSRRTGLETEKQLQTLLTGNTEVAYAVYYNQHPEKIMSAFLGIGNKIFCTEDSTSMLSEAVITQKPVLTLYSRTERINQGHLSVVERFQEEQAIHRINIDEFKCLKPDELTFKAINPDKNYQQIIQIAEQSLKGS